MKVCDNCGETVSNNIEVCPGCGRTEFTELLVSVYNDYESYLEEDNNG